MTTFEARDAARNHMAGAESIVDTLPADHPERQNARATIEMVSAIVSGLVYVGDAIAEASASDDDGSRPVMELSAEEREIRDILREKVIGETEPCSFDHHGHCQTHGWFGEAGECGVRRARVLLGIDREESGDGSE